MAHLMAHRITSRRPAASSAFGQQLARGVGQTSDQRDGVLLPAPRTDPPQLHTDRLAHYHSPVRAIPVTTGSEGRQTSPASPSRVTPSDLRDAGSGAQPGQAGELAGREVDHAG